MSSPPAACAVTGASGYIGGRIAGSLEQAGWKVFCLGRRNPGGAQNHIPFDLVRDIPPPPAFSEQGISCLVHCAHDFSARRWPDIKRINVDGSLKLFDAARQGGVKKIVFISSLAAFNGCRSLYGKSKLAVERACMGAEYSIIRPGIVYGKPSSGKVGRMFSLLKKWPVFPLIGNGRQHVYTCHIDDLCRLVQQTCADTLLQTGPIIAASRTPRPFRNLLRLAASVHGRHVIFIPIPWTLVWAMLKTVELAGFYPGFGSDSVISLRFSDQSPEFADLDPVLVKFRELDMNDC
ncbi:MAG TPA: NAD(P)-dependent oxidoreductase [Opitutaceae bacterium]|jgi:nucleoside-diphosphate-sugar epimerase|nr:NAD(P)-dependent oxidoreductase [Opitutaceae bacterium]